MLAHPPARLSGGVGHITNGDPGSPEPADGLPGALHGLVPDVERPVQVYQQPPYPHAPMIAGRRTTGTTQSVGALPDHANGARSCVARATYGEDEILCKVLRTQSV
jgi:hypothetical protein